MSIRVVIADHHELVRDAFSMLLVSAGDMTVVGAAATGRQAVVLARRERVDVVVMDVHLPDTDGIEVARQLTMDAVLPRPRTLLLSVLDDDLVLAALRAGAGGFLAKDTGPAELLAAIRSVAAGQPVLSPAATRLVVDRLLTRPGGI